MQNGNFEDVTKLTVYVSEQSHYCIEQAARVCGIPPKNVRYIESNDDCTIKYQLIEPIIKQDLNNNLIPFLICGNAGTTNSGAIDNLSQLYNICKQYNMWYDIAGAYGGLFAMTEKGKKELLGIENADSIVIDPHKTLFMPYGVGALIIKNKSNLINANTFTGACMPTEMNSNSNDKMDKMDKIDSINDSFNNGIELSRNFRGLTVWLPLKYYGINTFKNELNNKLKLTQYCYNRLINEIPFIKCKHKPKLTVFAFQIDLQLLCKNYTKSDIFVKSFENGILNEEMLDEMNKMFLDNVNKRNRVFLSAFRNITKFSKSGQFCLRIIILSFRTQLKHVNYAIEDIKYACDETVQYYANKLELEMSQMTSNYKL